MTVRRLDPAKALVVSFALVIAAGTLALRQPWASQPGRQLAWVEALFTATSATCVTGLTIRPPDDHTVAGQIVILLLIQVGGLGIMTFGLFFSLLIGRRLSMFGRDLIMTSLAQGPWEDFWPLLRVVMAGTGLIEGTGALLLAAGWWAEKGWLAVPWGVFHAVSAFCNAGFGLDSASLTPWRGNPLVVIPVGLLIVAGGLGFLPLTELAERRRKGVRRPLSLHSRTVFAVTAWLLVVGWIAFALLEWETTLKGLPVGERALAVWFQSITPRTAGFSTIDFGAANPATLAFTMVLMFIGASPGSTGGGIKTTTIGVLAAIVIARVRSRRQVASFGRRVGDGTAASAVVVTLMALLVVVGGMIAVAACEHGASGGAGARAPFLAQAFDVLSAFGTVGLSTGITPSLRASSHLVLTALMFVGRVGPLTFGLALAGRKPRPEPQFVPEELMVG
ncbi:MAG: TrkH family potassium uptake protein [Acidobacteriota bacterium]